MSSHLEDLKKGLYAVVGFITGAIISGGLSYWFEKAFSLFSNQDYIGLFLTLLIPIFGFFNGANFLYNLEQQKNKMYEEKVNLEIEQEIKKIKEN